MSIFISYDRADDKFAHRLADDLRANGFSVWRDVDDIPVGVEWESVTNTALKQCDVMLLIISPASMTSDCVAHQWQHFRSRNKTIIPLLHLSAELPPALKHLQPIDFQNASHKDAITADEPYQRALCKLQTTICQQNQPIATGLTSSTHRSVLGGWTTILAVLAIGGMVLSTFFAPILNSTEQAQNAPTATMLPSADIPNTQLPNASN